MKLKTRYSFGLFVLVSMLAVLVLAVGFSTYDLVINNETLRDSINFNVSDTVFSTNYVMPPIPSGTETIHLGKEVANNSGIIISAPLQTQCIIYPDSMKDKPDDCQAIIEVNMPTNMNISIMVNFTKPRWYSGRYYFNTSEDSLLRFFDPRLTITGLAYSTTSTPTQKAWDDNQVYDENGTLISKDTYSAVENKFTDYQNVTNVKSFKSFVLQNKDLFLDPTVSACGTLNSAGGYYTVTGELQSNGTCLTIDADDIVVDGAGLELFFQTNTTALGYGIVSSSHNNVTIKNFRNITGIGTGATSHVIYLTTCKNWTIINNTIRAESTGSNSRGIESITFSDGLEVVNNSIYSKYLVINTVQGSNDSIFANNYLNTTSASHRCLDVGISENTTVYNNTCESNGAGINVYNIGWFVFIDRNIIKTTNSYGIVLANSAKNIIITNNQIFVEKGTSNGIFIQTGTNQNITIDANNINMLGTSRRGISLSASRNIFVVNNTITGNESSLLGYGIYVGSQSTGGQNSTFRNNTVKTYGNSHAFFFDTSVSNNVIEDSVFLASNITAGPEAIRLGTGTTNNTFRNINATSMYGNVLDVSSGLATSSNATFTDCVFNAPQNETVIIGALTRDSSILNFTNVTLANGSAITFDFSTTGNSTINIFYYLDSYANWSNNGSAITDWKVITNDTTNTFWEVNTSGSDGWIRQTLQESQFNRTAATYYSNYTSVAVVGSEANQTNITNLSATLNTKIFHSYLGEIPFSIQPISPNATYYNTSTTYLLFANVSTHTVWYNYTAGNVTVFGNGTFTLTEGENNLTLWANNSANKQNFTTPFTTKRDTQPPNITIGNASGVPVADPNTVQLNGVCADQGIAGLNYAYTNSTYFKGADINAAAWQLTNTSSMPIGTTNVYVFCNDTYGNNLHFNVTTVKVAYSGWSGCTGTKLVLDRFDNVHLAIVLTNTLFKEVN